MIRPRIGPIAVLVALAAASAVAVDPASATAQQPGAAGAAGSGGDTTALELDELVVTADRTESRLGTSVAAVSRIAPGELVRLPGVNPADALRLVPGFALVDFDGLGHDPQMMVRGFYGGGEAEYVQVLLDGRPLNSLQSGLMAWDLVPPVAIEQIEVVRGAASALYGDAAVGGVVNLVSATGAPEGGYWDFGAGDHRSVHGGARVATRLGGQPASVFGNARYTEGFRSHAQRTVTAAGGQVDLVGGEERSLSLSTHWMWRDLQEPGPIDTSAPGADRRLIEPFYRYDGAEEWLHRATLDGGLPAGGLGALSGALTTEVRRTDRVRTIQLSLQEADTEERVLGSERLLGSVQLERTDLGLPWEDRLVVGVDASAGRLDAKHYGVQNGDRTRYETDAADSIQLVAAGEGARNTGAAYLQYDIRPADALRIALGARLDWLDDAFEPTGPDPGQRISAEHTAFSPRAGINFRWLASARQTGHVYVTAGRSFKAPTPDQLFDQRALPVAFPPITLSNPLLEPQRARSVEAGLYHGVVLSPGAWTAGASLAVYRMDVEDEIDFDLSTLSYGNIAQSRHDGVEAGARAHGPLASTVFVNYTLQDVTASAGANAGKALKAIPRHFVSMGASARPVGTLDAGVYLTRQGSAWLDDENAVRLPAYTRVDLRAAVSGFDTEFSLELLNVFDRAYSTTGFLDPAGTGTALLYPAAGRTMQIGVRVGV